MSNYAYGSFEYYQERRREQEERKRQAKEKVVNAALARLEECITSPSDTSKKVPILINGGMMTDSEYIQNTHFDTKHAFRMRFKIKQFGYYSDYKYVSLEDEVSPTDDWRIETGLFLEALQFCNVIHGHIEAEWRIVKIKTAFSLKAVSA